MTTIHYSGNELFMGAGLICRQPGDYTVQDVTAKILLANEPELFNLGDGKQETAEAPARDEAEQTELETDEGESVSTTSEPDEETTDDSHPETDEGVDEDSETEAPEAAQEPSEQTSPAKSLSKMNKTELEALAAQFSVEVDAEAMTADQMREAIKAAQDA